MDWPYFVGQGSYHNSLKDTSVVTHFKNTKQATIRGLFFYLVLQIVYQYYADPP